MTHQENNAVILEVKGEIEFAGPTNVGEMVFQCRQTRFERAGEYAIEFWVDNALLGLRKLHVLKMEQPPA
jgi:hypothetical protein